MSAAVLVAGLAPSAIRQHARHVAFRLTESGRVLVATSQQPGWSRMLPGDVGRSTVLGDGRGGYPIWTGGLTALLGLRRRRDIAIVVWWPRASARLLVMAALIARFRGERVVLDEQFGGASPARRSLVVLRLLATERVMANVDPKDEGLPVKNVLAVCGGDAPFAHAILRAFAGFSNTVVDGWRLRVDACIDLGTLMSDNELRHSVKVTFNVGLPMSADLNGADVVVVPHAEPWAVLATVAVRTGASAVIVGHPAAGTVARTADGAWLARLDPASILAAIEHAGDAASRVSADEPVSADRVRSSGERLLAVALKGGEDSSDVGRISSQP